MLIIILESSVGDAISQTIIFGMQYKVGKCILRNAKYLIKDSYFILQTVLFLAPKFKCLLSIKNVLSAFLKWKAFLLLLYGEKAEKVDAAFENKCKGYTLQQHPQKERFF